MTWPDDARAMQKRRSARWVSVMAGSAMADSGNQPLRAGWTGVASRRRVMEVRMSDTELGKPKTIIKMRMDRRFQMRSPWGLPGSALSSQQAGTGGAGDMRLAGHLIRTQRHGPRRTL